jgi:glutathione S-transferase
MMQMSDTDLPLLIIGNKNYSSWSLRPWLLLRTFGVAFRELKLPLDTPEFEARIGDYSPSRRVPALHDGDVRLWDSLAIAEYANERWLGGRGWPADLAARAYARAISAEMHSGFTALRREMPMNCRKRVTSRVFGADAAQDIARVQAIWRETRRQHGGSGRFLFGAFGIADAMYAPVVLRFISYGIALGGAEQEYADAIVALPALQEWLAEAATETLSDAHERMKP